MKRKRRSFRRIPFFLLLLASFLLGGFLLGDALSLPGAPAVSPRGGSPAPAADAPVPESPAPSVPPAAEGPAAGDAPALPAGELSAPGRLEQILFLRRAVERRKQMDGYTPFDDIAPSLRQAIVAVEDSRFYRHHGFDPESILRAALVNLQSGEIEEGASTITQQLAKNLFLGQERTFGRKAEELALALALEARCSKEEILELYLNTIYFGSGNYGIRDAARDYFAKAPGELELAEAAMLAGLPNAPSLYSPYVDFILAKKRQFVVLDAMERAGYITREEAEDAKIRPIYLAHE